MLNHSSEQFSSCALQMINDQPCDRDNQKHLVWPELHAPNDRYHKVSPSSNPQLNASSSVHMKFYVNCTLLCVMWSAH